MADAYAKEFEKWLQGGGKPMESFDDRDSVDLDDPNNDLYNCETKKTFNNVELTPVLPSDCDGKVLNSGTHQCFQDEPPILEPVRYGPTKITDDLVISNRYCKNLENNDHCITQTDTEKRKVEALKDKPKYIEPEKCYCKDKSKYVESEKCCCNKMEKSENIFDKFSLLSDTDDFPPPLIPSHEAHLTTVDAKDEESPTEKSYATLQNLSPNFCAMEADSTSEMMKGDENGCKDGRGKAPVSNDISMECDSTCMLSVSPHNMVSPGSNLECDNSNVPFNIDVSADGNLPWNSFSSRETYTSLMPFSEQTHLDYRSSYLSTDGLHSRGVYHHDSGEWDRECPKLEAVQDVEEMDDTSPPIHYVGIGDPHEPPVLSVVPPPSLITPRMAARRKRHTIDTVESVSSKCKTYSNDSSSNKTHVVPFSSKSNSDSVKKKDERKMSVSKRRDSSHSKNRPRPKKHRERSKTLPIVDLTTYGNHLPKDLYDFVVTSSQLSIIQNRMHRLVYLLFPQLNQTLKLMSPESSQFETLLKDLIHYLKEPLTESKCEFSDKLMCLSSDIGTSDSNGNDVKSHSKDTSANDFRSNDDSAEDDNDSDVKQFPKSELYEDSQCSQVITDCTCSNKDLSQHSSSCVLSKSPHSDVVKQDSDFGATKCKSDIPEFSRLSLNTESEGILKNQPSVLIHKNPSALHRNFCKLSCNTLQLLLPDLNVSLTKEFLDAPKDLLHFIDSVIASNTDAE